MKFYRKPTEKSRFFYNLKGNIRELKILEPIKPLKNKLPGGVPQHIEGISWMLLQCCCTVMCRNASPVLPKEEYGKWDRVSCSGSGAGRLNLVSGEG